jgi:hypothetical protein
MASVSADRRDSAMGAMVVAMARAELRAVAKGGVLAARRGRLQVAP